MEEARVHGCLKKAWPLLFLCLLAAGIYTYKLSSLSFENYDHFQFAKTADEMKQSGNLLAMTHDGQPYMNKPHLLFWLIWLFSLPFGSVTTFSARLPAVLSAIACIAFTYLLANELFNKSTAFFSGLILLSSWDFAMNARRVRFDIMLTMFTVLSLYLLLKGMRSEKKKMLLYCAGGAALALAFLTKGPPALIHILLPFPLFLLITRKPRTEWVYLLKATCVAVGIVLVWLLVYINAVGFHELLRAFQFEFVERIDGSREIQLQPFYYYLYNIPGGLLPWSLLIPLLIPFLWKKRLREHEKYLFPALWFLSVLAALSLVPPKETRFSFPIFPAMAILLGAMCAEAVQSYDARKTPQKISSAIVLAPAFLVVPLLLLLAILIPLVPEKINHAAFPCTIFFLLLSLPLTFLFFRSNAAHRVFHATGLVALVGIYAVVARVSVLAAENAERSPYQSLYYRNATVIHRSSPYCYRFNSEELDFYNRTRIPCLQDTFQFQKVLHEREPASIFILNKEYNMLPDAVRRQFTITDSETLRRGKGTLLLLQKQSTETVSPQAL